MSLLDVIHIILRHIPYSLGSSGVCLFVHIVLIERMSLVMTFLGFHHVFLDATLGISCNTPSRERVQYMIL